MSETTGVSRIFHYVQNVSLYLQEETLADHTHEVDNTVFCVGVHLLYGALSQRGLLDANQRTTSRPDGRLKLTASAFNRLWISVHRERWQRQMYRQSVWTPPCPDYRCPTFTIPHFTLNALSAANLPI